MKRLRPRPKNLIYGHHPVVPAIEAHKPIEKILLKKGLASEMAWRMRELGKQYGIPVQVVPVEKLDRLCRNQTHQGVAAFISAIVYQPLEEIVLSVIEQGKTPFVVMLDGVTDVRNFGAIARTAACMGVHAIVVPTRNAAAANADAVKVSAGGLLHVPVCREERLVRTLRLLKQYGLRTIGCSEKASNVVYESKLGEEGICLVFGSEEDGISMQLMKEIETFVKVPIGGAIDSLNVSVAVGMIVSEAVRQRRSSGLD